MDPHYYTTSTGATTGDAVGASAGFAATNVAYQGLRNLPPVPNMDVQMPYPDFPSQSDIATDRHFN